MVKRNQFFENRHPGIKIAFKIGVSDANRAKCKQTNECKQKITSCVKKLQFIISKNLDATLSVTGTLAPFRIHAKYILHVLTSPDRIIFY